MIECSQLDTSENRYKVMLSTFDWGHIDLSSRRLVKILSKMGLMGRKLSVLTLKREVLLIAQVVLPFSF